jgi:trans-L-3-hydroxyproline dehydratase
MAQELEPYSIPELSVDLIVPATDPEAAGYIIMEVMGYPIYSSSNTICTATAVLEAGIVPKQEGTHRVVENTITGKACVLAHSEIVVNCDDAMVECSGLRHILFDDQP